MDCWTINRVTIVAIVDIVPLVVIAPIVAIVAIVAVVPIVPTVSILPIVSICKYRTNRLRKALGGKLPTPRCLTPTLLQLQLVEISIMENRPRGV